MALPHLPVHRALLIALALAITHPVDVEAQTAITADSSGIGTNVGFAGTTYTVTGGTVSGTNLFHSFDRFNVPTGNTAIFGGPAATTNVISRVMSGEASTIDGRISTRTTTTGVTAMPSANFILINPAGVSFGPNMTATSLDIAGAFRVSTADYVTLGADATGAFSAKPEKATVLSSAAPQAFGFLGNSPAAISVNGRLQPFGTGKTVSLIGGNVQISGVAARVTPQTGGLVQIVSVASPGEVNLGAADLGFSSFERHGDVNISGGALVQALVGGTVVIRGGKLTIADPGTVVSVSTTTLAGPPVGVDLRASESIAVRNSALVQTLGLAAGTGSGISIVGGTLSVTEGGRIESQAATGTGGRIDIAVASADILNSRIRTTSSLSRGGDIDITASGTVTVAGATGEISTLKTISTNPLLAGSIFVDARDVVLQDGGKIQSGNRTGGLAGESVNISAANTISISSLAGISSQSFLTAGAINISAPQLTMDMGFINASTHGAGTAGRVLIDANTVSLANGAQIGSSSQLGTGGAGGSITINAPGSVTISGKAPGTGVGDLTFSLSPNSGVFSTAGGTGNAGQIGVFTPIFTIGDGGRVSVVTRQAGNAGTVLANVGSLILTGDGKIESSTTGSGAGGAITVGGSVTISGAGSGLFSTASSTGNAGVITVSGTNVSVANGGAIDSSTTGAGAGGAINVSATGRVEISGGGSVTADSFGSGITGDINITAGTSIILDGGTVSTRAMTSDGGNIKLTAPEVVQLTNSQITTSVESGVGGGGNITIDPEFVILQGSSITANAFGGPGGNITIIADNFITDSTTSITASSALSTPGTVSIQSPENNLQEAIAQLPGDLVDASRLLRGGCSARRTGAPSSFMVAGRGGVPVDADGYLPSFSTDGAPRAAAASAPRQPAEGILLAAANQDCLQ